jgi:hypothetical protein
VPDYIAPDQDGFYSIGYKQAKWMLERNVSNRPLTWGVVNRYRELMNSGDWTDYSTPLIFDREVTLLNGGHRLTAVALDANREDVGDQGTHFRVRIEWDAPHDVMRSVDTGRKREPYLWLTDQNIGGGHARDVYSMARTAWGWEGRHFYRASFETASPDTVYRWIERNPNIVLSWEMAAPLARRPLKIPISVGGAFSYATNSVASTCCWEFLDGLSKGDKNHHGSQDPRWKLREWTISRQMEARGTESVRPPERLAYMIKAWNAWLLDKPVSRLIYNPRAGERFPSMLGKNERGEIIEDAW